MSETQKIELHDSLLAASEPIKRHVAELAGESRRAARSRPGSRTLARLRSARA